MGSTGYNNSNDSAAVHKPGKPAGGKVPCNLQILTAFVNRKSSDSFGENNDKTGFAHKIIKRRNRERAPGFFFSDCLAV